MTRALVLIALLPASLLAAAIFTKEGRVDGKIIQQDNTSITLQRARGKTDVYSRETILTAYDDEGLLIWSHPTIAKNDTTPDRAAEKIALANTDTRAKYRGFHLGAVGGYGLGYGNATFSTYPLATGPDYRTQFAACATGAWYWSDATALSFSAGFSERKLPVKGLVVPNVGSGNAYWATQFIDVRAGYRLHSDIFFVEVGVLAAIKVANAPMTLETFSATINTQYAAATQRSFAALSFALGMNFAITQDFYLLALARIDHGVSSALNVNVATATDTAGNVLSSAPLSIVPLLGTLEVGAALRL